MYPDASPPFWLIVFAAIGMGVALFAIEYGLHLAYEFVKRTNLDRDRYEEMNNSRDIKFTNFRENPERQFEVFDGRLNLHVIFALIDKMMVARIAWSCVGVSPRDDWRKAADGVLPLTSSAAIH